MTRFPTIRRTLCLSLLCCLLLFLLPPAVFGAEENTDTLPRVTVTPLDPAPARGGTYRAEVQFQDGVQQATAFRLLLTYDTDYLTLTSIQRGSTINTGDFHYMISDAGATVIFASADRPVSLTNGSCCTLVFQVREDAAVGSASLLVTVDRLVNTDLEKDNRPLTAGATVEMPRLLSDNAQLTALVPSAGELTPSFSPEITEYTLSVPFEVTELTFTTAAADNGTCRVNRKNLGAGGSKTTFVIRVTAEDGKSVSEYVLTATRGEKVKSTTSSKTPSAGNSGGGTTTSRKPITGQTTANRNTDTGTDQPTADDPAPTEPGNTTDNNAGGTTLYGTRSITYNSAPEAVYVIAFLTAAVCGLSIAVIILAVKPKKHEKSDINNFKQPPKHWK